ncbi:RNA polymerase sigma-70 factor [Lascolabacillus massiliensis]|jgi:RNA polymerase sigma-70 factor (family 1)|uniref:RNA polymerase sigma-70 factor n=1 Tax=Lascolabacillus massiliensis TaxID=1627894 RepID=UPI0006B347B0|nr:RNA polymerase sigma-70 factor [Lascolabacillus massiliensis]
MKVYNEADVIKDLKRGSGEAFEIIYNRYVGKLYNFMLGITRGDEYMSEEMVQTAFIRLWETRERIDTGKSLISYLATIAKNTLYNKYKRQTVELIYREMVLREETEIDHTTEQQVEGEWLKRSLDDLIDQMPPGRKNIYKLSRQQEMSTKEIAEKLGISVSTVETQLSLATKYMKNELLKHRDKLIFIALLFTLFF